MLGCRDAGLHLEWRTAPGVARVRACLWGAVGRVMSVLEPRECEKMMMCEGHIIGNYSGTKSAQRTQSQPEGSHGPQPLPSLGRLRKWMCVRFSLSVISAFECFGCSHLIHDPHIIYCSLSC